MDLGVKKNNHVTILLHAVCRLASVPPGLRCRDGGDDADDNDEVDDALEIRPTNRAAQ